MREVERLHRRARDPRRARQDAAPARPRRHPRPADARSTAAEMQQAGPRADRSRGREPLSVPRDGRARRAVRRGHREHRHRRPGDDPLGGQEPRARRGGRRSGRLRARAGRARRGTARSRRRRASALARKAFAHTAAYDGAIASHLGRHRRRPRRRSADFPETLHLVGDAGARAALRREPAPEGGLLRASTARPGPSLARAEVLQGKELSYNNLLDLDAALRLVRRVRAPAAAIIKHNNPCGAAVAEAGVAEAYRRARETDPVSAFGGIVAVNRPVDGELARELSRDLPRVRDRAGLRARGAGAAGGEEEPAPAGLPTSRRDAAGAARAAQRGGRLPGADARSRHGGGGRREGRLQAGADAPRSCAISTSPGASASTSSRTPSCSPPAGARWASAPGRCRASTRCASPSPRRARRWPARSSPPTPSSRSATASTRRPRRAPLAVIQPGGSVRDAEVDRRRRRARHGDGPHRRAPLPALALTCASFSSDRAGASTRWPGRSRHSPLCERLVVAPGNPGHRRRAEGHLHPDRRRRDRRAGRRRGRRARRPGRLRARGRRSCAGLGDAMRAAGLPFFGPSRAAAEIEGSKAFAKRLMADAGRRRRRPSACSTRSRAAEAFIDAQRGQRGGQGRRSGRRQGRGGRATTRRRPRPPCARMLAERRVRRRRRARRHRGAAHRAARCR